MIKPNTLLTSLLRIVLIGHSALPGLLRIGHSSISCEGGSGLDRVEAGRLCIKDF